MKHLGSLPIAAPRSFSVAPAPRPTERSLVATERALRSKDYDGNKDMNEFLLSEAGQRALEAAQPEGTWERAQDFAYDSWEATGPKRYQLARAALALDERCSDAWLILAEEERSWNKQKRCFDRAIAAAERFGRDEGLLPVDEPEQGSLYGTIPGRTIMRAYVALARCQLKGGYRKEARALYIELIDLDPEDHMGLRQEVVPLLHLLDDREALRTLLDRYPEDAMTPLPYERLWLAIAEGAGPADVERLAQEAREVNPYVPDFLRGNREFPDQSSQYVIIGGEDEAADYAVLARRWWMENARTRAWLDKDDQTVAGGGAASLGELAGELDEFKRMLHRLYRDRISVREFMDAYGALNDMEDGAFTAAMGWVADEIDPYLPLLTFTYADPIKHSNARIWIEGGRPRCDRPDLQRVLDKQYEQARKDGLVL